MLNRELLALDTREVLENVDTYRKVSFEELMQMINLLDDSEIDEKAHRRQQRLNDCGSPACRLDPHTGNHYWFSQRCGLFRMCPTCLDERAKKVKLNMQEFIASGNGVKMLRLSESDAKRLCRRLDKLEYERFPIDQEGDILFVVSTVNLGDEFEGYASDLTLAEVDALAWSTIVLTPEGRNRSGKMTVCCRNDGDDEFEYVQSPSLVSDASMKEQAVAMEMARRNTATLNPRTAEEVEEALADRMWEAYRILKSLGYNPRMYYGMQKVVLGRISWINNHNVKREKQHRKSSFEQLELPIDSRPDQI